jgi:hypothetical protein
MARKAPKSYEDKLLERARQRGVTLHAKQVDAKFKFLVRPTTTVGVDLDKLQVGFEDDVFSLIKNAPFESPLTGIVLFPKILDPSIATMPDSITHKRKERSFFVSLNIPFAVWSQAPRPDRVDLLADNLIESIRRIPARHLTANDCQILDSAINQVRNVLKAKSLN